jgi:oligosaccharyltransferase complex subunit epsilon
MPPKQRTPASTGTSTASSSTTTSSRPNSKSSNNAQDILQGVWNKYVKNTPQRTKLLDTFLAFLVVVGALQFLYVVVVGNFVRTPVFTPPTCPSQLPFALKKDGIRIGCWYWAHS